jgi:hypothetical protein
MEAVLFKYSLNGRYRDTYFATNFFTTFFMSVTIIYNSVDDSLLNIGGNFFSTPFAGLILKVVIKEDPICIPTILYYLFY